MKPHIRFQKDKVGTTDVWMYVADWVTQEGKHQYIYDVFDGDTPEHESCFRQRVDEHVATTTV